MLAPLAARLGRFSPLLARLRILAARDGALAGLLAAVLAATAGRRWY
jgi:hypothetical protein